MDKEVFIERKIEKLLSDSEIVWLNYEDELSGIAAIIKGGEIIFHVDSNVLYKVDNGFYFFCDGGDWYKFYTVDEAISFALKLFDGAISNASIKLIRTAAEKGGQDMLSYVRFHILEHVQKGGQDMLTGIKMTKDEIQNKIETNELVMQKLENENSNLKLGIFKTEHTFKEGDILVNDNRKVRFIGYAFRFIGYGRETENIFNVVNIKKDGTDGASVVVSGGFSSWRVNEM